MTQREVLPLLRVVGQMNATYVICEGPDGMYLLDQHAAHERVLFERLRRAFGQTPLASQRLLFPVHLTLDEPRAALLSEYEAAIHQLGFEVRPFSGTTVALTAAPDLGQYGRGAMVQGEMRGLVGATAPPLWQEIVRWPQAIPQYDLGHLDRLKHVDRAESGLANLWFFANYRGGVSVSDRIVKGGELAITVDDYLRRAP